MKFLIDVDAPGVETFHIYEPAVPNEIAAFIRALVKSRTRGPEPKVSVQIVGSDHVVTSATQLLALQSKASALRRIVECEDRDICAALENAKNVLEKTA